MRPTATETRRLLAEMRDADLARHLGLSRERVRQIRARTGIPAPPRPAETRREAAVAALKAGADPETVATQLGVAASTVRKYGQQAGLHTKAEPAPHGTRAAYARHHRHGEEPCDACREANRLARPGARADDARRQRVLDMLSSGATVEQVAAATGMHPMWVRRHGRAAGILRADQ